MPGYSRGLKMKIIALLSILSFYFASVLAASSYADEATCHAGVLGIDVSKNQRHIDWEKVANGGYKFAFIKASEGIGYPDKNFAENIKSASVNTLLAGPYHFARPAANENPEDEAEWFLQAAGDYIKRGYLRPVLDVEIPPSSYPQAEIEQMETMSDSDLQDWVLRWMNYVKDKTGQTPILYTNRDYYSGKLKKLIDEENYDIWISDPSTTSCSIPLLDEQQPKYDLYPELIINWKFWQWYYPDPCASNKGKVPGIDEDVDLDVFNGYESDLLSYTCDLDYGIAPTVQAFKVTPIPPNLNLGETFTIDYTVLDKGGSGLKQVELWRKEENGDWPSDPIQTMALTDGNGPITDSFTDTPPAPGRYWYGLHVVDNNDNWNDEKNSNTNEPSISSEPVEVEVKENAITPTTLLAASSETFQFADKYSDLEIESIRKVREAIDSYMSIISEYGSSISYDVVDAKSFDRKEDAARYLNDRGIAYEDTLEALNVIDVYGLESTGFCLVVIEYDFVLFGETLSILTCAVCDEKGESIGYKAFQELMQGYS